MFKGLFGKSSQNSASSIPVKDYALSHQWKMTHEDESRGEFLCSSCFAKTTDIIFTSIFNGFESVLVGQCESCDHMNLLADSSRYVK